MNKLCISRKPCKNQLPLAEIGKALVNRDDFTDDLLNMGFTKGYQQGYNEALEDFANLFIAKSQEKRYLRHIWIRQTCEAAIRKLKKEEE